MIMNNLVCMRLCIEDLSTSFHLLLMCFLCLRCLRLCTSCHCFLMLLHDRSTRLVLGCTVTTMLDAVVSTTERTSNILHVRTSRGALLRKRRCSCCWVCRTTRTSNVTWSRSTSNRCHTRLFLGSNRPLRLHSRGNATTDAATCLSKRFLKQALVQ